MILLYVIITTSIICKYLKTRLAGISGKGEPVLCSILFNMMDIFLKNDIICLFKIYTNNYFQMEGQWALQLFIFQIFISKKKTTL